MAVVSEALAAKLKLSLDFGVDEDGKVIKRSKTFSHVKSDATDENILDTAKIIVSLQEHDLRSVVRMDEALLSEA
jgi:hypothetical protein